MAARGIGETTMERLSAPGGLLERVARMSTASVSLAHRTISICAPSGCKLAPETPAWDRTADQGVVSHRSAASLSGLGHLQADHHEITLPRRNQSRIAWRHIPPGSGFGRSTAGRRQGDGRETASHVCPGSSNCPPTLTQRVGRRMHEAHRSKEDQGDGVMTARDRHASPEGNSAARLVQRAGPLALRAGRQPRWQSVQKTTQALGGTLAIVRPFLDPLVEGRAPEHGAKPRSDTANLSITRSDSIRRHDEGGHRS